MDRMAQALAALERRPSRVGVLFIDLDDFKDINDTLGHQAGDRVLVEVARRLEGVARRVDTVARFGGDEFVLLCPGLEHDADLASIGDRVTHAISAPLALDGHDLAITGSVGVAATADPVSTPTSSCVAPTLRCTTPNAPDETASRSLTRTSARRRRPALTQRASYAKQSRAPSCSWSTQPIVRLRDAALTGVEALVRWRHPVRGVIPPSEFIALAEERDLIGAIDSFVLEEACGQLAAWQAEDNSWDEFTMSVNRIGAAPLRSVSLDDVACTLRRHAIAPSQLCLEITETALISDLCETDEVLKALSGLGSTSRARRLRNRTLGTGAPSRTQSRRPEDRPELHQHDFRAPTRERHRRGHHRHGTGARNERDRRGHRK